LMCGSSATDPGPILRSTLELGQIYRAAFSDHSMLNKLGFRQGNTKPCGTQCWAAAGSGALTAAELCTDGPLASDGASPLTASVAPQAPLASSAALTPASINLALYRLLSDEHCASAFDSWIGFLDDSQKSTYQGFLNDAYMKGPDRVAQDETDSALRYFHQLIADHPLEASTCNLDFKKYKELYVPSYRNLFQSCAGALARRLSQVQHLR